MPSFFFLCFFLNAATSSHVCVLIIVVYIFDKILCTASGNNHKEKTCEWARALAFACVMGEFWLPATAFHAFAGKVKKGPIRRGREVRMRTSGNRRVLFVSLVDGDKFYTDQWIYNSWFTLVLSLMCAEQMKTTRANLATNPEFTAYVHS